MISVFHHYLKCIMHTDIKPPTMVNITGEMTVRERSSVSYQCIADGFPVPDKM